MRRPQISVCVPTYNGREHLKECLDSIRAQSFSDFEVVICDDQSSDGTLDFARNLVQGDERFRFIQNPKRFGLVGNWNNSVALARGEWIKFVFQDDTIEPACLERLLAACQRFQCPFSFCDRHLLFDEQTPPATRAFFEEHRQVIEGLYGTKDSFVDAETFARLAVRKLDWNLIGEPTVVLFHRSVLNDFGGFAPTLIQQCDTEYWSRLASNVGVVHVPERLAAFRVHHKSTTSQNMSRREYRARLLDPLVKHYLILREAHYDRLRRELFRESGHLTNWWRLIWAAHQAWTTATDSSGSSEIKSEWQSVCEVYPRLREMARAGFFLTRLRSAMSLIGLDAALKKCARRDGLPELTSTCGRWSVPACDPDSISNGSRGVR